MAKSINDIAKAYGFSILKEKSLTELSAVLYHMRHDRTGLELVWTSRDEENKTFGIGFQTLPEDDTGVFHILEHSVLCGSDKYPIKEPFVELIKSSMNTFLNAMTFPDKTVYPISSKNTKDFFNLVRVYLDAVFHPLIYSKPEIFYQEGWHYELDENGKPSYKGVVFNEMKGAYAGVDRLVAFKIDQALFPDSPYRFSSGGDPISIPDLTYEHFIESHKKFYSPSNAYVFLDGSIDFEAFLKVLCEEYINGIEAGVRIAVPALQKSVKAGEISMEYELSKEEDPINKNRLTIASVYGTYADVEKTMAVKVLMDVLCGNNQAPLSAAILSQGLAEDVTYEVSDGVLQPYLTLCINNFKIEDKEKIQETLKSSIQKLIADGLDKDQVKSALANAEFILRERDYGRAPQGLIYGLSVLESWLYGGDVEQNLEVGDLFIKLDEKLNNGYFEALLKELFIDAEHSCTVLSIPNANAGEERSAAEQKRLQDESNAWTEEQRAEVSAKQKKLEEWQATEDSEEGLATIPRLELKDMEAEPEKLPLEELEINNIKVLKHAIGTGGIAYVKLYFDADGYNETELSQLTFLSSLLGNLKTTKRSANDVLRETRLLCGSLSYEVEPLPKYGKLDECKRSFTVSFSTLEHNIDKAIELVCDILLNTVFDNEKEVQDILKQTKLAMSQGFVANGISLGLSRVGAMLGISGVVSECTSGYSYYKWVSNMDSSWDWNKVKAMLCDNLKSIITQDKLVISITGTCDCSTIVESFAKVLPKNTAKSAITLKAWGLKKEGIVIPADISFACRGGVITDNKGYMDTAARIASYAYLWNVIRVQGGDYGTGRKKANSGYAVAYSYRDPSGAKSLESFLGIEDFINGLASSGADLSSFIVGTISDCSQLLTPRMKGVYADREYFTDFDWEKKNEFWNELLNTNAEQLKIAAAQYGKAMKECCICIVGSKAQIEQCKDLDSIETL